MIEDINYQAKRNDINNYMATPGLGGEPDAVEKVELTYERVNLQTIISAEPSGITSIMFPDHPSLWHGNLAMLSFDPEFPRVLENLAALAEYEDATVAMPYAKAKERWG